MTEIETRTVTFDGIETRTDDDGFRHLVGIVVPWDGEYRMPNGLTESFERSAFTKTLQERGDRIIEYCKDGDFRSDVEKGRPPAKQCRWSLG